MIIIFKLIGTVAGLSALATFLGMKIMEWIECGK